MSDISYCPIIALKQSKIASFHPVSVNAVRFEDRFWAPRLEMNRTVTLPSQIELCEATGRIDNFRRASGKKQTDFQGIFFNDSDVYKMLEGIAYSIASHPDSHLQAQMDEIVQEIVAAQDSDGYLNTYFTFERKKDRFTNLKDMHEIYCAGHLIQAAVAHHRATGSDTFLNAAIRLADHLYRQFGPEGRTGACGHEEAEMALVELYRETADSRYLSLAHLMVEARGRTPSLFGNSEYYQDHKPFTEQDSLVGHAVRHLYLCSGAADISMEMEGAGYLPALNNLFEDLTQRKMYVTGGAGARHEGEAFGAPYELPNERAYAETCAAIASVMWNWRMLHLTGDSKYADVMETALYNGVLSGVSLDGLYYFYENPLADRGEHRRQEWFGCACCPPNISRTLASLPGYTASVGGRDIYLHLYIKSRVTLQLPDGAVILDIDTNYPWDGDVDIKVIAAPDSPFTLHLRMPWWSAGATVATEGAARLHLETLRPKGFAAIHLSGGAGASVHLSLPMEIERVESHPHVTSNLGRIALRRGPIIYCIEGADHKDIDVWDVQLPSNARLTTAHKPELLGGVTVIEADALCGASKDWTGVLYAPYSPVSKLSMRSVRMKAIPYYAWANREPGSMQSWIPVLSSEG